MAATARQVADGIADRLDTINGLHSFGYVPDVVTPPMAAVTPDEADYYNAMNGGDVRYVMRVQLVVAKSATRSAQQALYDYMSYSGAKSVRAAIDGDSTLGGVAVDSIVERAENIGVVAQGDAIYLAVDFIVRVHG